MPPSAEPQTDLFGNLIAPIGDDAPRKKLGGEAKTVSAVEPSPELVALANQLPPLIHLGTSSWSYPGWHGLVYAGAHTEGKLARDGLAAYAAHPLFKTVSLDRTFYAPISEAEYRQYANTVPAHFQFLVKAPMAITSSYLRDDKTGTFVDSPHFLDSDYAINEFIAPCTAGLAEHCGPLVFQFPPQGRRATSQPDAWINALYRFLMKLPPGIRYAVEIRDPELLTERFFKCLSTTSTIFCVASHARMPTPREQIRLMHALMPDWQTRDFVCRWSLHAGFKYEDAKARYYPFNKLVDEDLDSRTAIAEAAFTAQQQQRAVFITINNKAEGSAPLSAQKLVEAIVTQRDSP
jgi:uncharacterized protein YecE (DUF72 family)